MGEDGDGDGGESGDDGGGVGDADGDGDGTTRVELGKWEMPKRYSGHAGPLPGKRATHGGRKTDLKVKPAGASMTFLITSPVVPFTARTKLRATAPFWRAEVST